MMMFLENGFWDKKNDIEIPIELKYKTKKQSAEDIGAMDMFRDIYNLERLVMKKSSFAFGYFFMITDNQRYIKKARKNSLRSTFATYDGCEIIPEYEYKHVKTKTGEKFYEENSSLIFEKKYLFKWKQKGKIFFLDVKV